MSTVAAFARRRRRGISTVITDFVAAELVWIDGPPTLNAFGATAYSRAVARNAAHQTLPSQPTITYTSGTPANVAIDATGLCTAIANGTSVITASATLNGVPVSITQTATVAQVVASASISPVSPSVVVGATQQFRVFPKDANFNDVVSPPTATWFAGSNVDGAAYGSVDSTGLFTASSLRAGDAHGFIHATYPNGVGSQFAGITIAVPTVSAIDASIFTQGSSAQSFTLTGANFGTDATPSVSGLAGTTVSDFTVVNSTTITGHISCTAGATIGSGTISVASAVSGSSGTVAISCAASSYTLTASPSSISGAPNATQQVVVTENGVDVTSDAGTGYSIDNTSIAMVDPPTVGTLSPTSITQGTSGTYTLSSCANLRSSDVVSGLPSGVTLSAYTVTGGGTGATFTLTATGSATLGSASLTISNTGHGTSAPVTLTVATNGPPSLGTTASPLLRIHANYGVTLNGSTVASVTDYGSIGTTFSQATSANQPSYVTNAHNGLPCFRFTGSQSLVAAGHLAGLEVTQFYVMVIGTNTDASGPGGRVFFGNYVNPNGFAIGEDSAWRWAAQDGTTSTSTGLAQDTAIHAIALRQTSNLASGFHDSTTASDSNGIVATANTTSTPAIGCDVAGANFWKGDCCEIIIFGSAISSADQTALFTYARSQWGTP